MIHAAVKNHTDLHMFFRYKVDDSLVATIQGKADGLELATLTVLLILGVRSHEVMGKVSGKSGQGVLCQADAAVVFVVDLKQPSVQEKRAQRPPPPSSLFPANLYQYSNYYYYFSFFSFCVPS